MHCLACGKGLRNHITLAQHLKDKHHGCNDADAGGARGAFTLGDLMAQAQAKRAAAAAQPAPEKHQKQYSAFTPGDVRGMREYLKVSCPGEPSLSSCTAVGPSRAPKSSNFTGLLVPLPCECTRDSHSLGMLGWQQELPHSVPS